MEEKIINIKDIEICTQGIGNPEDPCVLLIAGATVSMLFWDLEFCEKLANKGYFVVRFDFRDTGKSTHYPIGQVNYDIEDLVDDSIAILDYYKIDQAHLVGLSLGGMIAQIAALKYPQRVKSLTLMSTMPWAEVSIEIPEMDQRILTYHSQVDSVDWNDEDKVVEFMLSGEKLMSGQKALNLNRTESYIRNSFSRSKNFKNQFNHSSLSGAEQYYNQIQNINCPVIVIHGTEDTICHFKYAGEIMRLTKAMRLFVLEGTGHELHEDDWETIINAISSFVNYVENN